MWAVDSGFGQGQLGVVRPGSHDPRTLVHLQFNRKPEKKEGIFFRSGVFNFYAVLSLPSFCFTSSTSLTHPPSSVTDKMYAASLPHRPLSGDIGHLVGHYPLHNYCVGGLPVSEVGHACFEILRFVPF